MYVDIRRPGPIVQTIDNAGVVTQTQSDLLGRTIRTIQNYDRLAYVCLRQRIQRHRDRPADQQHRQDVTTDDQYDSAGRLVTQTAYDTTAHHSIVAEATKYLYTSTIDGSLQTGEIDPDSTDVLSQNPATLDWTITSGDRQYLDHVRPGRRSAHQHRPTRGDAYLCLQQRRPADFRQRDQLRPERAGRSENQPDRHGL